MVDTGIHKRSDFTPTINSQIAETFITAVKSKITQLRSEMSDVKFRNNMSLAEQAAICGLIENDTLTIKTSRQEGSIGGYEHPYIFARNRQTIE